MIAIDIRFMSNNMKQGKISSGVGLFCAEVLQGIVANNIQSYYGLITDADQHEIASKMFPEFECYCYKSLIKRKTSPLRFIDTIRFNRFLHRIKACSIWYPHANPYNYSSVSIPVVSTIHDLIVLHEKHDNKIWRNGFYKILNESTCCVTDSQYVKRDIIDTYHELNNDNVTVIPCPVVVNIENSSPINSLLGKKYILDINAYQERKNASTLIKAFKQMQPSDYALVFCGGYNEANYLERMKELCVSLNIEDKVFFFLALSIEERNWLFLNAELLVSPSLSEGFGRTPIEAIIAKLPVVCSRADSLFEATGGLARYYDDPLDYESLKRSMIEILNNPPSSDQLKIVSEKMKRMYDPKYISLKYHELMMAISTRNRRDSCEIRK